MSRLGSIALLVFLLTSVAPATAQEGEPGRDVYRVELVLIAHGDGEAARAVPAPDPTVTPRTARPLPPADPTRADRLPRRLPAHELRLAALLEARAAALPDQRPIGALGWQLGARALRAGRTVRLDGEFPGLLGFVRLRLSTRLVVELDLRWAPASRSEGEPLVFRLSERRAIRLNEVHYFDHPAFGVLLRIEREPRPGAEAGIAEASP